MPQEKTPTDRPFQVWAVGGNVHSGHDTEEAAQARCDQANKQSEELGTKTRFEVRSK